MKSVVLNSLLGKRFLQLREDDENGLHMKFRTVYHNMKIENPYTDYPDLINLQRLNGVPVLKQTKQANSYAGANVGAAFGHYIGTYHMNELKSNVFRANCYSVLVNGSTDKVTIEQEAIYILFLHDEVPKALNLQTLREFSTA